MIEICQNIMMVCATVVVVLLTIGVIGRFFND
jgi:hypothetical protein